jgi:hypothetical protein
MRELLVPGLHAGTVPKLYERLRQAALRPAREKRNLARLRDALARSALAVERLVLRELLPPLVTTPFPLLRAIEGVQIELSPNRIRIRLKNRSAADCELSFEQLGGRLVADIPTPGFVADLGADEALVFENSLAAFYHRADVELVKRQLERVLGSRAVFEINEDGLLVSPSKESAPQFLYRLEVYRPKRLRPRALRGARPSELVPPTLDSREILFTQQPVVQTEWQRAWLAATSGGSPARVLPGPPLL